MGTYPLEQVIKMWETGKLTTEQTIGQILLHLQSPVGRVWELERRMTQERRGRSVPPPPPQKGV